MRRLLLVFGLILAAHAAQAQQYRVITTCGTPPGTLTVGQLINGFVDTNGTICSSTGGGGTATAVTTNYSTSSVTTNWSTVNNTTIDTNSGNKGGGTLRVVLATDQPALTTPMPVGGDTAAGATDSGSPVKTGGVAKSTEQTAVTTGQRVNAFYSLTGRQIIQPYSNPESFVNGTTAAITDTTSTAIIASAGGSLRNYVTSVIVTNSHATVGTFVKILDGSTIIWEGYAAAVGGGFTSSFPVPLRGTAATAINCQPVTTGANVICSAAGYTGT